MAGLKDKLEVEKEEEEGKDLREGRILQRAISKLFCDYVTDAQDEKAGNNICNGEESSVDMRRRVEPCLATVMMRQGSQLLLAARDGDAVTVGTSSTTMTTKVMGAQPSTLRPTMGMRPSRSS